MPVWSCRPIELARATAADLDAKAGTLTVANKTAHRPIRRCCVAPGPGTVGTIGATDGRRDADVPSIGSGAGKRARQDGRQVIDEAIADALAKKETAEVVVN